MRLTNSLSLLAAACAALTVGCALEGSERAGASQETRGFSAAEPEVALGSDPRFVMRQRLDPPAGASSPTDVVTSAKGEPFSHRGRRWNLYPITVYPNSKVQVALAVTDPAMADSTSVWVFGPMRHDGSWGAPRRVQATAGQAQTTIEPSAYGQYAIAVGPTTADGFAPRYPSNLVRFADPAGNEVMAQITIEQDRTFLWTETGERWNVVSPLPRNVAGTDPPPGSVFQLENDSGTSASFRVVAWSSSSYFMPEDGQGYEDAVLGNLDGLGQGILELNPSSDLADQVRYLVLDAIGADGQRNTVSPALLRVVPAVVNGRAVEVRDSADCASAGCSVAIWQDDGTEVDDGLVKTFKPTYYDFDETSKYDLELTWQRRNPSMPAFGAIAGNEPPAAGMTRYPVYFAHGFNSSATSWETVLATVNAQGSDWSRWTNAASVPGFQPVPVRAEQLRRNLTAFLAGLSPRDGETYLKVNVVAHSMGGLDTRYLIGSPQYNDRCAELACRSAAGQPESCCPSDVNGNPVPWRDRIVSVTTLSTPHCGSSFADAGLRILGHSLLDFAFRKVASGYFGLDEAGQEGLRQTFGSLSQQYCRETMSPSFPVPTPSRSYDWACATGEENCATGQLANADRPVALGGGGHQLPAPTRTPTIFSWASLSCITGTCGDFIDPGLLIPHLDVLGHEGDNDGVVATQSARFGIYMGIRSNDHFHWNRTTYKKSTGFFQKLFGSTPEPADRFHVYWLGELARAGY